MAYVILGDSFSFPEGNAATNRVFTYSKGFWEKGIEVHVICLSNAYLTDMNGVREGINYYHPFGQTKRNRFFMIRRWHEFYKYLATFNLLRRIMKIDGISVIHTYSYNIIIQLFAFISSRLLNTIVTLERSEHPLQKYRNKIQENTLGEFRIFLDIKLSDGILCITDYLIDLYQTRGCCKDKLIKIPSTVDPDRFKCQTSSPFNYDYILYSGSLTLQKDGVDILIGSYEKIIKKHPQILLVLIGKGDDLEDELYLRNLVKEKNIDKKVFFLGQIPRNEIPFYICNARLLALARPKSRIADAGFPSKLTEYLATGNPIIVTKVGEIPQYLKDNYNAFLSEPGDVDAFADKLDLVLSDYNFALKVGQQGRKLTEEVFNYKIQTDRIVAFVRSIETKCSI